MKIELTKKDSRLFASLRFVLLARARKNTHYALACLKVESDCIACTNRHALHVAYIPHKWEPGLYEVLQCTRTKIVLLSLDHEAKYVSWREVIPHHNKYIDFNPHNIVYVTDHLAHALSQQGVRVPHNDLSDAIDTTRQWNIYFGEPNQAIRAVSRTRIFGTQQYERLEAIIMPLGPVSYTVTSKSERRHNTKKAS